MVVFIRGGVEAVAMILVVGVGVKVVVVGVVSGGEGG